MSATRGARESLSHRNGVRVLFDGSVRSAEPVALRGWPVAAVRAAFWSARRAASRAGQRHANAFGVNVVTLRSMWGKVR